MTNVSPCLSRPAYTQIMSHNIKSFLYPLFKSLKILQNLIFTLQRNSLPITTRRQDLLHHPSCSFLKQTCMVTRQMKTVAIRLSNPLRTYEKKLHFVYFVVFDVRRTRTICVASLWMLNDFTKSTDTFELSP